MTEFNIKTTDKIERYFEYEYETEYFELDLKDMTYEQQQSLEQEWMASKEIKEHVEKVTRYIQTLIDNDKFEYDWEELWDYLKSEISSYCEYIDYGMKIHKDDFERFEKDIKKANKDDSFKLGKYKVNHCMKLVLGVSEL